MLFSGGGGGGERPETSKKGGGRSALLNHKEELCQGGISRISVWAISKGTLGGSHRGRGGGEEIIFSYLRSLRRKGHGDSIGGGSAIKGKGGERLPTR